MIIAFAPKNGTISSGARSKQAEEASIVRIALTARGTKREPFGALIERLFT
jgi:hypothetical protein